MATKSNQNFFTGLDLLRPFVIKEHAVHAGHDVILLETSFEKKEDTPQELREALEKIGWYWDEFDSWHFHT
jgi:hypothetical protein